MLTSFLTVVFSRWAFGTGNIRYEETLAGGAMMDAGAYVAHISRSLASAAGYGPLTVTSAAAKTVKGWVRFYLLEIKALYCRIDTLSSPGIAKSIFSSFYQI